MAVVDLDIKIALGELQSIISENKDDKTIMSACKLVFSEVKALISSDLGITKTNFELSEEFKLLRTKEVLEKASNGLNETSEDVITGFAVIGAIIDMKINDIKGKKGR